MNESNIESTGGENTPEAVIQRASTIEELKQAILEMGQIKGTGRTYTPEEVVDYIDGVASKLVSIHYVTRSYGIRNKVRELLGLPIPEGE